MVNEVILVGKLKDIIGYKKFNDRKWFIITMMVEKPLRNENGEYDYEEIECALWQGDADQFIDNQYMSKMYSIKGRIKKMWDGQNYVAVEKIRGIDSHFD